MEKANLEVTIREFLRNYKKLTAKNKTIIISNHGKPTGVFISYEDWKNKEQKCKKKINILELVDKYSFDGPGDMSQNIDEIAYGAPNPYRDGNS